MKIADLLLLGRGGSAPSGPLGRLTTSGVNFLDAGKPWKYRAVTAFTWLQGELTNAARGDFIDWARSIGANTLRVFGMWSITGFDPRSFPNYYAELDDCCDWLRENGLRLHFVAFTDQVPPAPGNTDIRMSPGEQDTHIVGVCDVLRGHDNMLLEVCNEDWKNGRVASRWPPNWFDGILTTRSSWEDGNTPLEAGSVLDYTTEHDPRDEEWARKSKNLLEVSRLGLGEKGQPGYFPPTNKPAIAGEPKRLEEATPRQYADYVAVAELFASGACLHGLGLERCQIPGDASVARAVAAVWADPPPSDLAATGTYVRGGLPDCPLAHDDALALRTFAMIAGSRATAVVVSPKPGWQLQAVNGWRVTRTYGFENNTIDLER